MSAPCHVREWDGFIDKMAAFYHSLGDRKVREKSIVFRDEISQELGLETSIHSIVQPIIHDMAKITFRDLNICNEKVGKFVITNNNEGGRADVCLNIGQQVIALGEFKRNSVILSEGTEAKHPSELYNDQVTNVKATLCQTYSYMLSKDGLKYGFFTNYSHWCFMRRCVANKQEIVETTSFF